MKVAPSTVSDDSHFVYRSAVNTELFSTGCPKKNSPVAFLLISPMKLHLLGFLRTVLKSAGSQDSKTVPESSN